MIKRLFEKWLCLHKWSTYSSVKVQITDDYNEIVKTYTNTVLICDKCGKITKLKSS